jgi:hypothetical protein
MEAKDLEPEVDNNESRNWVERTAILAKYLPVQHTG